MENFRFSGQLYRETSALIFIPFIHWGLKNLADKKLYGLELSSW